MLPEQQKQLARSVQLKKENRKFITGLGRKKNIDHLFHAEHESVFSRTNCLDCANCCKTTSPIFRDVDIDRISRHFGMKPSAFTAKYLHIDEDQDYVLNQAPCPFLGEGNFCDIYDVRPKACRDYPHTDRKNMQQVLDLTYRNTLVCPAVSEIVDNIRKASKT